jgi:hypothetical protein
MGRRGLTKQQNRISPNDRVRDNPKRTHHTRDERKTVREHDRPIKGIRGRMAAAAAAENIGPILIVRVHVPNARKVGVVHMPLQGVPPGERLQATPNPQLSPERIRSSLHALLVGHARLDADPIQVRPIHRNPTARPPVRVDPPTVGHDMTLEIGNAMVLLFVVAPDDRAEEMDSLVDLRGAVVTLQVARGVGALVRVRTPTSARGGPGLGGSRTSGRERLGTGGLGLGGGPRLLLLLGRRSLDGTVLLVVVGGRNVINVAFTVRFGATAVG